MTVHPPVDEDLTITTTVALPDGEEYECDIPLANILTSDGEKLSTEHDLQYPLALIREAIDDAEMYQDDFQQAARVIAHWAQELQYKPDVQDYSTGTIVPPGTVPKHRRAVKKNPEQESA